MTTLPQMPDTGRDVDVVELHVEVPPGSLIDYDLRLLCSALHVLDPACLAVETDGLTRAIITIYKKPPLADLPYARGEDLVMDADGYITVGRYHDGQPARRRLYVPGSGAQRGALFGTTGAGKSRALQLILAAEKRSGIVTWLTDLKFGQSVPEARGQVDWLVTSQEGMVLQLEAAVKVIQARTTRYAAMGRSHFIINRPDPLLYVHIDEANRGLENGAPYRDRAAYLVKEVGRTGRSVGVGIEIAAQAGHIEELGGSDTLRGMIKEGETTLLRWSSSMMQSLVSDGLLPPGTQLAAIPKLSGPPRLRSRFAPTTELVARSGTGGMAYLLGSDRPTALMRFFRVGSDTDVDGLDPKILELYGPGEPRRLEEASWDAVGEAYQARDQPLPEHLVQDVQDQAQAAAVAGNGQPRKLTISARVLHALEGGPLNKADLLAAVMADGGTKVTAGGISNTLGALKTQGRVHSPGHGVYERIE